jgi:hypothetical protein
MLEKYDIGMVVNLWDKPDAELYLHKGLIYIHWPIGGGSPPDNADIMIEMIHEHMFRGVKVLVHCEAGVNRSVWLVSKLAAKWLNIDDSIAFANIATKMNVKRVRPGLQSDLGVHVDSKHPRKQRQRKEHPSTQTAQRIPIHIC